ncbi:MAG: four helix bundle protein [Bacteroidales bacterium]|nr:four helix bundle protein [Bacteroidales bacterium]
MAIYTNLPIYKASYSLLLDINRMMPNVPRDCRYTIGQELRKKIMEIIVLIYRANRTRDKLSTIVKMRESLLEVQVYIRLMCDMKYISERKYINFVEQTTSMSKQLSAWEKSEISRRDARTCV